MKKLPVLLIITILFIVVRPLQAQIDIKNHIFLKDTNIPLNIVLADSMHNHPLQIGIIHALDTLVYFSGLTSTQIPERYLKLPFSGSARLYVRDLQNNEVKLKQILSYPGWVSIVPPLLAILLALLTRQVLVALFFGIFSGSLLIFDMNPFTAFAGMLDKIIINSLNDPDRISILVFSLVLGGMVGVISKSGGTFGIVDSVKRLASTRRRGLLASFFMGILIFFDDYANTLIVGNTMRPLTDKLRISREKLAYIIDSTAAPVANIAIISTWIGYEISILNQSFTSLGLDYNPYISFIRSIGLNFYPIFTLLFIFILIMKKVDYGPMYHAEIRARDTGKLMDDNATPLSNFEDASMMPLDNVQRRWYNALVPIGMVILMTFAGLIISGMANITPEILTEPVSFIRKISLIIGESNSFHVLLWASFSGSIIALLMGLFQRLFSLHQAIEAWIAGIKAMVPAALILTAAWSIGEICLDIYTAQFVVDLSRSFISPHFLPVITFITAAIISFATGTSWGTMAILLPIVIPMAYHLPTGAGHESEQIYHLILTTFASVLAGATFGDHCSPISDTTIMSSMASGSDHIDHVRTQLPYAVTVGLISIIAGYIPAGFYFSPLYSVIFGVLIIFVILRFFGKKV